jgi:hypothetical protein
MFNQTAAQITGLSGDSASTRPKVDPLRGLRPRYNVFYRVRPNHPALRSMALFHGVNGLPQQVIDGIGLHFFA